LAARPRGRGWGLLLGGPPPFLLDCERTVGPRHDGLACAAGCQKNPVLQHCAARSSQLGRAPVKPGQTCCDRALAPAQDDAEAAAAAERELNRRRGEEEGDGSGSEGGGGGAASDEEEPAPWAAGGAKGRKAAGSGGAGGFGARVDRDAWACEAELSLSLRAPKLLMLELAERVAAACVVRQVRTTGPGCARGAARAGRRRAARRGCGRRPRTMLRGRPVGWLRGVKACAPPPSPALALR
jgi:hypothetical protein